ncbi:MAG: phosphoribosyl-ATP diphosphatase [Clostridiales bacterium]|nr:phosphoribosyl-ATP diphosphatase [Clostridiales bacterium]
MDHAQVLYEIYQVIQERKTHPKEGSYTNYLLEKGLDKVLKKVGEETAESIIAAKNEGKEELVYELSDLLYHISVLMAIKGVDWDDVFGELARRELKEGNLKKQNTRTGI